MPFVIITHKCRPVESNCQGLGQIQEFENGGQIMPNVLGVLNIKMLNIKMYRKMGGARPLRPLRPPWIHLGGLHSYIKQTLRECLWYHI